MAGGILAHLGHRMTKQQEVLATEGPAYLLQNSDACSGALRRLAQQAECTLPATLVYRPEVSGDDLERPDVVGFDDQSREVAILEGKFYAGLMDNQPNAYLSRLSKATGGLLLFVVPDLRVPRIWEEVTSRARRRTELGPFHELAGSTRYTQSANGVTLMKTSWRELLDTRMVASKAAAEPIRACRISRHADIPSAAVNPLSGTESPFVSKRHRNRNCPKGRHQFFTTQAFRKKNCLNSISEGVPCGCSPVDELPVIGDAKAMPLGDRNSTIAIYAIQFIAVIARVNRWDRIGAVWMDQRDLVEIRVAHRANYGAVSRSRGVNLAVDSQCFGKMCDLHRSSDPHIVLRVRSQEIRAARDGEIRFRLDTPNVFRLKDRCFDLLSQYPMCVGACTRVAKRIFVPEVVRFIASVADIDGVGQGAELAGAVNH